MLSRALVALLLVTTLAFAGGNPESIFVEGPMVIGFVPPLTQQQLDSDYKLRDGTLHVAYTVGKLTDCLAYMSPVRRLKSVRAISLLVDGRTYDFEFGAEYEKSMGIVLAQPGAKPQVIFTTSELSTFPRLAIKAASDYFAAPSCQLN